MRINPVKPLINNILTISSLPYLFITSSIRLLSGLDITKDIKTNTGKNMIINNLNDNKNNLFDTKSPRKNPPEMMGKIPKHLGSIFTFN